MATQSSVLAWRIPGTGEPGGLPSYGVAQSRTRLKRLSGSSTPFLPLLPFLLPLITTSSLYLYLFVLLYLLVLFFDSTYR